MKIEFIVTPEQQGQRLDVFLARLCEEIPSRSFAGKLIQLGHVLVEERARKSSFILSAGERVVLESSFLEQESAPPQAEPMDLSILYEDEHVIVIDKPAGLVVHPGAGVRSGTLVNAILAHCGTSLPSLGGAARAGIVHRLDRDTSGVMVVAKTQVALTRLSEQFADHSHTRIYHALVYGTPSPVQGRLETWHGRDAKNRIKYAVQVSGVGKKAILDYRLLRSFAHNALALVECTLQTGRTHQIRVQLSHIGHGVVGDALYAPQPGKIAQDKTLAPFLHKHVTRQLLHAHTLGFLHPLTRAPLMFHAPYPNDFQTTLTFLESLSSHV